jgi:methionine sulfoxide reductase heme-binding subunit
MRVIEAILASKWTKVVVFPLCLVPLALLVWRGFHNDLTLNPTQYIEHTTGDWVLRFLVITLAITPLRKLLHLSQLIRFRRMMGLFAFFYVCLHFTTWLWLDRFFDWSGILDDIAKRPYITVGFTAFLLLIPLAVTSTAGWIRRLGGKRWQKLHRLIYVAAVLGVIHFWWLVKSDIHKPMEYALMVGVLLCWRIVSWLLKRRQTSAPRKSVSQSAPKPDVSAETV